MSDALDQGRQRLTEALRQDRPLLTRFVRRRLAERADLEADDVVSDVVLRLFERADLLAQVENVTAYLLRALGNSIVDRFRRRRETALEADAAVEDHSALAAVQRGDLRQSIEQALALLSAPERAVWLAVEVEGWTFRQLAERWGEPIGTLLSRKNRATKTLRKLLAEDDNAPPS